MARSQSCSDLSFSTNENELSISGSFNKGNHLIERKTSSEDSGHQLGYIRTLMNFGNPILGESFQLLLLVSL